MVEEEEARLRAAKRSGGYGDAGGIGDYGLCKIGEAFLSSGKASRE